MRVLIPCLELKVTMELYEAADPALDLDAAPADTASYWFGSVLPICGILALMLFLAANVARV